MDETFFLILLVTGFCATTADTSYKLVQNLRTWYDADSYCADVYTELIQRDDMVSSKWFNLGYSKAWIGLITDTSSWILQDGNRALYFNWSQGQPDSLLAKLCVAMTDVGDWYNRDCTELRQSVCSNGDLFSIEPKMSWTDAVINCQANNSTLVQIPDDTTNAEIRNMINGTDVWIDIHRYVFWMWSETGKIFSSPNWNEEEIQDLNGNELCAAIGLKDGTLTQESCNELYPFICKHITEDQPISEISDLFGSAGQQSKITFVKLKIQTTANLTNPRTSADFEQQLCAMLANPSVTNFKLTWKKPPGNP